MSFYFPCYCELSRPTEQFFCSTWCWLRVIHGAVFHWEFSWIWNMQNDLTHVLGVLVLAVDWVPGSLLFCGVLSLYLALLVQQYSQSFLPTWQLASKRNKAEAASLLELVQHHFCHSLLVKAHHKASPDSKGRTIEPISWWEDWLVCTGLGRLAGSHLWRKSIPVAQ